MRERLPDRDPLLLVVGGATLFDYREELERFTARAGELRIGVSSAAGADPRRAGRVAWTGGTDHSEPPRRDDGQERR